MKEVNDYEENVKQGYRMGGDAGISVVHAIVLHPGTNGMRRNSVCGGGVCVTHGSGTVFNDI